MRTGEFSLWLNFSFQSDIVCVFRGACNDVIPQNNCLRQVPKPCWKFHFINAPMDRRTKLEQKILKGKIRLKIYIKNLLHDVNLLYAIINFNSIIIFLCYLFYFKHILKCYNYCDIKFVFLICSVFWFENLFNIF